MRRLIFFLVLLIQIDSFVIAQSESGNWFTRAPLPTPRQEMPHVVLDGKVFVLGGIDANRQSVELVEAYDAQRGTWETVASLPPTLHHLGAAVANGKIYVIGGYVSGFSPTNKVYEYDPTTGVWTEKSPMPIARGAHVAVTVDDKIYVVGGVSSGAAQTTNQVYDPAEDAWATLAPMPTAREHLAAAALNGQVYVVGGRRNISGSLVNLTTLEAYDPVTDTWDESPADLKQASGGLAAAALNGRLYAFGGEFFEDGSGVFNMTAEYNPETNAWRDLAPMPVPRHGIGAVAVADTIFIIGGGPVAGFATSNVNSGFIPPKPEVTSSAHEDEVPVRIMLRPGYPNPFITSTNLSYFLPKSTRVTIRVLDALGRTVDTLRDQTQSPGEHRVTWHAADLRSGVYFVKIVADETILTQPVIKH